MENNNMLKSDKWIIEQCKKNKLLTPFVTESVKTTDKGLSHVSHDLLLMVMILL